MSNDLEKVEVKLAAINKQIDDLQCKLNPLNSLMLELSGKRKRLGERKLELEGNNCHVYVCFVDNVAKYVGQGTKDRWKHCESGVSSCAELNRDKFSGKKMNTLVVLGFLSKQKALLLEADLIDHFKIETLYNKSPNTYNMGEDPDNADLWLCYALDSKRGKEWRDIELKYSDYVPEAWHYS